MGIRYDKDNRRATNGPMIFFSILKDEAFEEEIRGAIISGLSFYAYRFPGDSMMCYGSSEGYVEGIGKPGFVIGFFSPSLPFITIPYDGIKRSNGIKSFYDMPTESTPKKNYIREVEEIIKALQGDIVRKVVASRVIVEDLKFDIADKFYELCQRFPDAFVFCFGTPATGCWIGASPELLLESANSTLHSMALAGTRKTGTDRPWDEKNIEEQKIVADYICATFERNGLRPVPEKTFTKITGSIEHICTPIASPLPDPTELNLESLLKSLSPTPALCGYPKDFALEEIEKLEEFDRGCYGGFCGPFHSNADFTFNVVLRCASISETAICKYIGGGITAKSNPEDEWIETELKAKNTFG